MGKACEAEELRKYSEKEYGRRVVMDGSRWSIHCEVCIL